MIYSSKDMESRAVLDTAAKVCAAARTAPKTKGMDGLVTCVLTGEDKNQLAAQMRKLADALNYAFFARDADNVEAADAVVLFGMEEVRRGLGWLSVLSFWELRRLRGKGRSVRMGRR